MNRCWNLFWLRHNHGLAGSDMVGMMMTVWAGSDMAKALWNLLFVGDIVNVLENLLLGWGRWLKRKNIREGLFCQIA